MPGSALPLACASSPARTCQIVGHKSWEGPGTTTRFFCPCLFSRIPSPESRVPASQSGFTLLEVLAAIALLAFAFAIGLRAMSGSLSNSTRGEAMTQTALEVQSLLDMQGLTDPLRAGEQQGRFPDGASWRLLVSVYQPPRGSAVAFSTPGSLAGDDDNGDLDRGGGIDLFRLDLDVRYAGAHTLHFSTLKAQLAQRQP
jgi:general secretion pathway protein I